MNEMAEIVLSFENKKLPIEHIPGPEGVRGRNSDNTLIKEKLGWAPTMRLKVNIESDHITVYHLQDNLDFADISPYFFYIGWTEVYILLDQGTD